MQVGIESFFIVSVTPLYFPVVLGCSRSDAAVFDAAVYAELFQCMDPFGFYEIDEFYPFVRLDLAGLVAEKEDRSLDKIHRRIGTTFFICDTNIYYRQRLKNSLK